MTESTSHHTAYRRDIDGLRAIAVLLVVIFHAFPYALPGGFIGVDVFFVISGFLISTIIFQNLASNSFSLLDFYSRRINRIFPALSAVLIFAFIYGWFFFIPDDYAKLTKHIFAGGSFVSNLVSRSEFGYFDDAAELKPLLHLWSLGIEEQFYIVWPIVLVLAFKLRLNLLVLTLTMLLGSFSLNVYKSCCDTTFAFFSPQTRAWELLIGAALAWVYPHIRPVVQRNLFLSNHLSGLGFLLLAFGLLTISKHVNFPGWWALLPTMGTALVIASTDQSWLNKKLLSSNVLVFIGLISYPLYLWHWILLSFLNLTLREPPSALVKLAVVSASFALAYFTFVCIEKPLRQRFNKHGVALFLLVLMLLISGLGLYIFKNNGLFGQTQQELLKSEQAIYPCPNHFRDTKLCVFGNLESNKTIIIFGDSHAEHLTNALNDSLGKQYKLIFIYESSCFFSQRAFPGVKPSEGCQKAISKVSELANSFNNKKIEAIIRSQRWHGYGFNDESSLRPVIEDALHVIGLSTDKIIIIGSTADVDLRCEKFNFYFKNKRKQQTCKDDIKSKNENKEFIRTTQKLADNSSIYFIYPYEKLCPNDKCNPIVDNQLLYSDNHHLTKNGAMLIMPDILRALKN